MNKQEPDSDDEGPYEEFLKWEYTDIIEGGEGEDNVEIDYVKAADVPKILLSIFISKKDEKRTDAAELLDKYADQGEDKLIIEHIIDQIWTQYDYDNSGSLERAEAFDFIQIVLQLHEKHVARDIGIKPRQVTEQEVEVAIELADENHDGVITKEEMTHWLAYYMSHSENTRHVKAEENKKPVEE